MNRMMQPAVTLFAIGLVGLGVLALIYHDFALVWQPVPLWVHGRTPLAYASGVLMFGCGLGILFRRTARWSVRILFPYLIVWVLLKVPALFAAPGMEAVWLGFGEIVMLMAGGWILWAAYERFAPSSILALLSGDGGLQRALVAFGLAVLPIGLSHLVYIPQTVQFVPAWLPPGRTFWACLTGAGQIGCGLGILFGILPRVAAWCEAGMVSIFTLLVWLPLVISKPADRGAWTVFFISWILGSSAWIVAQAMGSDRGRELPEHCVSRAAATTLSDASEPPLTENVSR